MTSRVPEIGTPILIKSHPKVRATTSFLRAYSRKIFALPHAAMFKQLGMMRAGQVLSNAPASEMKTCVPIDSLNLPNSTWR